MKIALKNAQPLFVITGAMGGGKSTIVRQLKTLGFFCVDEPAREILKEQRAIDGAGVYDKDKRLFKELMLSRSLLRYEQMANKQIPCFFDRGIPDNVAYARLFELDDSADMKASEVYRYNTNVFLLPAWKDIYAIDDERTISFEEARDFGEAVSSIYRGLGYNLIEVPFDTPSARAKFIINRVIDILS
ncbi:AAA family ATPase [Candidatus Berkiella cookevillensis]|uniref:AAA family ATPase n=1 Tax=Candidatus Berkiella cookevillensis TaxID=437022 RepID=A0A0Q9YBK2_9GAMM|nr:AAA family ATPase [Candidatus Berkiella cookevillensis]MCS5709156.1 AAA family ATPase [Candidatus Berkiella cookevillensis]